LASGKEMANDNTKTCATLVNFFRMHTPGDRKAVDKQEKAIKAILKKNIPPHAISVNKHLSKITLSFHHKGHKGLFYKRFFVLFVSL